MPDLSLPSRRMIFAFCIIERSRAIVLSATDMVKAISLIEMKGLSFINPTIAF